MNAPIFVSAPPITLPDAPPPAETADLLRQLVELQKEQLGVLRAQAAAHDGTSRWRSFLARWHDDFPDIGPACKQVLPVIERAYLGLIQDLTDKVRESAGDGLDNEFALAEFLDRYGMRLSQLGVVLGQLGTLAEATPPPPVENAGP